MRVYISGAITGRPTNEYKEQFGAAEQKIWDEGNETINPARLDHICPDSFNHDDYMDICIPLLKKCDAIYMLEGWKASSGAREEYEYAATHDLILLGEIEKTTATPKRFLKGDIVEVLSDYDGPLTKGTMARVKNMVSKSKDDPKTLFIVPHDGTLGYWYDPSTVKLIKHAEASSETETRI